MLARNHTSEPGTPSRHFLPPSPVGRKAVVYFQRTGTKEIGGRSQMVASSHQSKVDVVSVMDGRIRAAIRIVRSGRAHV